MQANKIVHLFVSTIIKGATDIMAAEFVRKINLDVNNIKDVQTRVEVKNGDDFWEAIIQSVDLRVELKDGRVFISNLDNVIIDGVVFKLPFKITDCVNRLNAGFLSLN